MNIPTVSKVVKGFSFLLITLFSLGFGQAVLADDHGGVAERIKPVGEVCTEGQDCGGVSASAAAAAAPAAARSGKEIYDSTCAGCHAIGVAGAPKFGDAAGWAPRVARGVDALVTTAISGVNAMPPRGTCAACSDDEIKATVQYMVDGSQ